LIAITAADSVLGQSIIEILQKDLSLKGVNNWLRLIVGNPVVAVDIDGLGIDVVSIDCGVSGSMEKAFSGVETLVLLSRSWASVECGENHLKIIDAAKKSGVYRVIYVSCCSPMRESNFKMASSYLEVESYLKASGLEYIILRSNLYASSLNSHLMQAKTSGIFAIPSAKGKVAYITLQDVANAIVGAIHGKGLDRRTYYLTGPESFDSQDIAVVLSEVLQKKIIVEDVPLASYADFLRSLGNPQVVIEDLVSLYAATSLGEYSYVSSDASYLLWANPTSIRYYIHEYLQAHRRSVVYKKPLYSIDSIYCAKC
jgi:NAD(P)H dehydrogenase (quinone)